METFKPGDYVIYQGLNNEYPCLVLDFNKYANHTLVEWLDVGGNIPVDTVCLRPMTDREILQWKLR